jgi:itaconate CoA-transferase
MQPGRSDLSLSGITVVSFEEAIAAPLASRHLADWGARVITTFDTMRSGDLNQTSY